MGNCLGVNGVKEGSLKQKGSDRLNVTLINGRTAELVITENQVSQNEQLKGFVEAFKKKQEKKEDKKSSEKSSSKSLKHHDDDESLKDSFKGVLDDITDFDSDDDDDEDDDDYSVRTYWVRTGNGRPEEPVPYEDLIQRTDIDFAKTELAKSSSGPWKPVDQDNDVLRAIYEVNYRRGEKCIPSGKSPKTCGILTMIFLPAMFFYTRRNLTGLAMVATFGWLILGFLALVGIAWPFWLGFLAQIALGILIYRMPQNKFDAKYIYTKGNIEESRLTQEEIVIKRRNGAADVGLPRFLREKGRVFPGMARAI